MRGSTNRRGKLANKTGFQTRIYGGAFNSVDWVAVLVPGKYTRSKTRETQKADALLHEIRYKERVIEVSGRGEGIANERQTLTTNTRYSARLRQSWRQGQG